MLTFLHISDTHISDDARDLPAYDFNGAPHPNRGAENLIEAIRRLPFEIDFVLHTGDVCADPFADNYRCARDLLRQIEQPLYLLPGNHDSADLMFDILHDGEALTVLRDARVQVQDHHLLALDTSGEGDVHAPTLGEDQIEWFAEQLESIGDQRAIVATHHPLIETGMRWLDETMRVQNGERIQSILQEYSANIAGVFHGHIHQQTNTHCDGVLYVSCPSTWFNLAAYPGVLEAQYDLDTPGGFNLVLIQENRTFVRRYNLPQNSR